MKNRINNRYDYSQIKSLKDLQQSKKIIKTKLKIRKHLLNKHVKDLNEDFSADYVYRQSLKLFKIENGALNILPKFINTLVGDKKGLLVTIFSAIGAGITTLVFYKNTKKTNKKNKEDQL